MSQDVEAIIEALQNDPTPPARHRIIEMLERLIRERNHWQLRFEGKHATWQQERSRAEALRAALQRIADPRDGSTSGDGHARCQQIARAALQADDTHSETNPNP